jgi:hypothetical protein
MSEDDLNVTLARIRSLIRKRVDALPSHGDYLRAHGPATAA